MLFFFIRNAFNTITSTSSPSPPTRIGVSLPINDNVDNYTHQSSPPNECKKTNHERVRKMLSWSGTSKPHHIRTREKTSKQKRLGSTTRTPAVANINVIIPVLLYASRDLNTQRPAHQVLLHLVLEDLGLLRAFLGFFFLHPRPSGDGTFHR